MSAPRKTSKRALPNVPGAAMVQALGDAVFGKGNAVVEATYPVTFTGRPVTVRLSVEEVVRYLTREGWEEDGRNVRRIDFTRHDSYVTIPIGDVWASHDRALALIRCVETVARVTTRHPLDVVDAILAARHGAAPPGDLDAITAAILRLFRVAPDKGIAEDEVVRHLLASGLDVDSDDVGKRLIAMTTGNRVLVMGDAVALTVLRRGEPDKRVGVVLTYARGPAFPATGGAS